MTDLEFETLAVRAGVHRSQFNEHSEALYLTSSFVFETAAQAAARFANAEQMRRGLPMGPAGQQQQLQQQVETPQQRESGGMYL